MKMNRLMVAAVTTLALAAGGMLAACSGQDDEQIIRDDISSQFDSITDTSSDEYAELVETVDSAGLDELGIDSGEFIAALLEGFDYSIDSVDVSDDGTATASVTITSKDMNSLETAMTEAYENIDTDELMSMSETELYEYIGGIAMDSLKNAEVTQKDPVTLTYTKNDSGDWEEDASNSTAISDAMIG